MLTPQPWTINLTCPLRLKSRCSRAFTSPLYLIGSGSFGLFLSNMNKVRSTSCGGIGNKWTNLLKGSNGRLLEKHPKGWKHASTEGCLGRLEDFSIINEGNLLNLTLFSMPLVTFSDICETVFRPSERNATSKFFLLEWYSSELYLKRLAVLWTRRIFLLVLQDLGPSVLWREKNFKSFSRYPEQRK